MICAIMTGSFIGASITQGDAKAIEYIPMYNSPPNNSANVGIDLTTDRITVKSSNSSVSVRVEQREVPVIKWKTRVIRVQNSTAEKQLNEANNFVHYLLYNRKESYKELKCQMPKEFDISGREEEPDSVNHST